MKLNLALPWLTLALAATLSAQSGDKPADPPQVYLVGSIHELHLNPDNRYSIPDLLAQIAALQPDLVCGEIAPEAFDGLMEGYFPPEAACLAQMASRLNYRFVPVDWRLDYKTQAEAEKSFPKEVEEEAKRLLARSEAERKKERPSAYDFFNGQDNLALIDRFFEEIVGKNPVAELAQGAWQRRNRTIVENGLAAAGSARRIVFVFGSDHLPGLQRELARRGITAHIPERLFNPAGSNRVDESVRQRWHRNLDNLKKIRSGLVQTDEDNVLKVKNSKRLEKLAKLIDASK